MAQTSISKQIISTAWLIKNKWLIAHPDAPGEKGHFPGLIGANIEVNVTKKQMEEI